MEINIDTAYQLKSFYYQSLLTRLSFLDNLISIKESYETYLSYLREKKINTNEIKKEMISIGTNVLDDIPKIAKANKVIMINESHYDFRHRYFLYLAIDSLYKYGYRHLCIEDYINNGEVKQTFPTKSNGFYIMDPFMAQLIRKANSLGFQLHSYEDTSSNSSTKFNSEIEKREYNQASNLANLYKTDSINKWVVYAGYEHINKKSFMSIYKSCAQYFYDFTGVDPYSINQNEYSDITNKNVLEIDRPVGYYSLDTASSVYKKEQVNLYILNNIEKHPYEYPLPSLKSSLTAYSISSNQNIDSSGYLFIYIKNEFDKLKNQAIPVYIGQINLKKKTILYLPENNYISFITYNEEDVMIKCNMKLL